jgi:hypothetical protein
MRPETRLYALRATAKVAFCVVGVACKEAQPPEAPMVPVGSVAPPAERPAPPPGFGAPPLAPRAARTCDAILDEAFPKDASSLKPATAEVRACCGDEITLPMNKKHAWDCCNVGAESKRPDAARACSPWGPPMPPAMRI